MRISVLGLILMFLFPITLFAQQRVDVTGKTLVVSNNGEGQEVLPYTNILVLEAGDSTLVKGVVYLFGRDKQAELCHGNLVLLFEVGKHPHSFVGVCRKDAGCKE